MTSALDHVGIAEHLAAIHPLVAAMRAPGWHEHNPIYANGVVFGGRAFDSPAGLRCILSADEINGSDWLHLSVSRRSRIPSYEDLLLARRTFLHESKPSYQVFPRATEYRSLPGATVLHLWQPLGADPFPDPLGERAETVAPR